MDITPLLPKDMLVIKGYGKGFFNISGQKIFDDIIVFRETVLPWNQDLNQSPLDIVLKLEIKPELVILGLGQGVFKPDKQLAKKFAHENISIEFMDSGSACRTYNILLAEGREICIFLKR